MIGMTAVWYGALLLLAGLFGALWLIARGEVRFLASVNKLLEQELQEFRGARWNEYRAQKLLTKMQSGNADCVDARTLKRVPRKNDAFVDADN